MTLGQETVEQLLESIAARQPTPGGGAVAAVTAGLAAALGEMVVRYRLGNPSVGDETKLTDAAARLTRVRADALRLADADAEAFDRLSALWKLPADDRRGRPEWAEAVAAAIDAPRGVMGASQETLDVLHEVREAVGRRLRSDLAMAALLAEAAAESAAWNVRINLPHLGDAAEAARVDAETDKALQRAHAVRTSVEESCRATDAAT